MNASISHHQADISLQIAFLLLIKLILQLHASFFDFSLKHEYCKKSFHLQVNVIFPPLFFVLCCFYSFHIHFFSPHQTDSSIQSFFFCSPFSNISFYFSVGLFSSQEIPGRKIVEECFLCLARGESPHSGPSLKEMGLNS